MSKIFVDACLGKETPYTPVWMMRQAGRYLPEYKQVRAKAGDFLSLCHNPKLAAKVTLQPVDRLDVDAAILFSDILVIPNEMGMELTFVKNEGPKFSKPIKTKEDLASLGSGLEVAKKLSYVYDTIKILKKELNPSKALIGFSGAPWTLATYMIEGQGSKTYNICKKMLYKDSKFLHEILAKVTCVVKYYLEEQIKAGADVVQIFDSWAGALEKDAYFDFSWKYIAQICTYIKQKYPHIPIIVFPKAIGTYLDDIYGDFDVFGVDWSTPMELAKQKLGNKYVLQGNMEPCRLYCKQETSQSIEKITNIMQGSRHIFNLGHGILPDVPVENAKHFVDECKRISRK